MTDSAPSSGNPSNRARGWHLSIRSLYWAGLLAAVSLTVGGTALLGAVVVESSQERALGCALDVQKWAQRVSSAETTIEARHSLARAHAALDGRLRNCRGVLNRFQERDLPSLAERPLDSNSTELLKALSLDVSDAADQANWTVIVGALVPGAILLAVILVSYWSSQLVLPGLRLFVQRRLDGALEDLRSIPTTLSWQPEDVQEKVYRWSRQLPHLDTRPLIDGLRELHDFVRRRGEYRRDSRAWPRRATYSIWGAAYLAEEIQRRTPEDLSSDDRGSKDLVGFAQSALNIRSLLVRAGFFRSLLDAVPILVVIVPAILFGGLIHLADRQLQFSPAYYQDWYWFLWGPLLLVASSYVLLKCVPGVLRFFTGQTWTDLDDLIAGAVTGPIVAASVLLAGWFVGRRVPDTFKYVIEDASSSIGGSTALQLAVAAVLIWLSTYIFNRVLIHVLRKWAEKTSQTYDDMAVALLQVFGTFLTWAIGIGAILVILQPELEQAGAGNVLLPYAIIVSVVTAILGYASNEAFSNLFAGVLLQIDRPFATGHRLKLADGRHVDVREIGMRSTQLYDVLANSIVSIPNRVLATMEITNMSRPDIELRFALSVPVPHNEDVLRQAELELLRIAHDAPNIDQMRLLVVDVPVEQRQERPSLNYEFWRLGKEFGLQQKVHAWSHARAQFQSRAVFNVNQAQLSYPEVDDESGELLGELPVTDGIQSLLADRRSYQDGNHNMLAIRDDFHRISEDVFAVRTFMAADGYDLSLCDSLVSELSKEPVVYSQLRVGEEGCVYIELELHAHALQMERTFEIVHSLRMQFMYLAAQRDWRVCEP